MDLNIYNIHFVVGLFGKPMNIEYYPNIERNIDTSGILILDYGSFNVYVLRQKIVKHLYQIIYKEMKDVFILNHLWLLLKHLTYL